MVVSLLREEHGEEEEGVIVGMGVGGKSPGDIINLNINNDTI